MKTTRITQTMMAPVGKVIFLCMTMALTLMISCSKENATTDFTTDDSETTSADAITNSYTDDVDDLATISMGGVSIAGGRVENTDGRLACATITRTAGDDSAGTLKIDFGTGCTGPRGNVRKGVIWVAYNGKWNQAGAQYAITFDNYSINDVAIAGIRTISVISATDSLITSEVKFVDGKLTWPDGRVATREVNHTRQHELHTDPTLNRMIISGTASGTNRRGVAYSVKITTPLVYTRTCVTQGIFIPVSGVKLVTHNLRELTVDYGDGTCDDIVTITTQRGHSITVEVKKDI